ncbi:MAG: hypothetical protein HY436_01795 [Candidatus Liptonbacteria bacterium]|nr:hypothetical protein [Candidatus Liptonbacteria bacterium]
MLPKEPRELTQKWVRGLVHKVLTPRGAIQARPLKTNNYERHKNWKITIGKNAYLLRVENPFTNKVRRMFLKDEIAVLKLLQPYRVAPKLIVYGRYNGRLFLIEEWMRAKRFSIPPRPTRRDFEKIIEFIVRVNRVPLSRIAKKFKFKEDCLDRLAARRKDLEGRIRAGRAIKEFRPIIKEILPLFKTGFAELAHRVRALPKSVWRHPVLSYRDISQTNIFAATPHYLAVDWEWHSVGIADPSLSLVVFMQRFNLLHRRKWILKEYQRLRLTPHLDALIDARILERLLGGLTWSLGWIANMKRAGVPQRELRRAIRGGIKNIRVRTRELTQFLQDGSGKQKKRNGVTPLGRLYDASYNL